MDLFKPFQPALRVSDLPQSAARLMESVRPNRKLTLADRILTERVRLVLEAPGAAPAVGLHVYVYDGTITIYGVVDDVEVRNEIGVRMASLPGTRKVVVDHLQVKMGPLQFS